ncbi:MAG: PEP-CTERM sorting domain-containing protein [Chlorobia bacterium]|nr:PEP-CTERM sorting domain-containing protein [Fimbriimonadaceae bacterium]
MIRVHRLSLFSALFTAALFAPILANASTRRHDVPDANYLNLGSQFNTVGAVNFNGAGGSATLIGANWILTAAHVKDGGGGTSTGSFFLNGTTYGVTGIVNHPSWSGTVGTGGFDFALGFIAGGVAGVTPSGYYAGAGELGQIGTSVGFGIIGDGNTGATGSDGQRRGFHNVIDVLNFQADLAGLLSDFDNPGGTTNTLSSVGSSPSALGLEGNVTFGDSGGGLFVNFAGSSLVVGVTSYLVQANFNSGNVGKYGDASGWADISLGAPWIQQVTGIAPTNPVPEPATMAALGLGALALLRRRKK